MNVADMVREWLEREGYEGLCCVGCLGCGVEHLGCPWDITDCRPAYHWDCDGCSVPDDCAALDESIGDVGEFGCYHPKRQGG